LDSLYKLYENEKDDVVMDEKELFKQISVLTTSVVLAIGNLSISVRGLCYPINETDLKFSIKRLKKKSVLAFSLKRFDFSLFQNVSSTLLQECKTRNKELEDCAKKRGVSYGSVYLLRNILLNSKYKKLVPLFDKHVSDLKKAVPFLTNLGFTFFSNVLEEV
jgi:hypothetical protein